MRKRGGLNLDILVLGGKRKQANGVTGSLREAAKLWLLYSPTVL